MRSSSTRDEARVAALVRALRRPVLVRGREEEHVARLDERAVVGVDRVADDPLLEAVGEAARVEAVLQPAAVVVVDAHDEMMRARGGGSPCCRDRRLDHCRFAVGRRSCDRVARGRRGGRHPRLRFTVRAVYGKRTDEIAAWLDSTAAGADVLVVQGGINDIAQGRSVDDAAATSGRCSGGAGARAAGRGRDVLPWNNGWPRAEPPIGELNAAHRRPTGVPVLPFHERSRIRIGPGACGTTGRSRATIRRSRATAGSDG